MASSPHSLFEQKFRELASVHDASGTPVQAVLGQMVSENDVAGVPGAYVRVYQGGDIYFSRETGVHVIYGVIRSQYNRLGGASALGLPLTDEIAVIDTPGDRFVICAGTGLYLRSLTGEVHLITFAKSRESKVPPLVSAESEVPLLAALVSSPPGPITIPNPDPNELILSAGVITLSVPSSGTSSGGDIQNNTPTDADTAAGILMNIARTLGGG